MLRFILKREVKDGFNGLVSEGYQTLDLNVPELEAILQRGGFSETAYDQTTLIGVEIRNNDAAKEALK